MSGRSALHPAFLAAPEQRQWRGGKLVKLWEYLERTAKGESPSWVRVILPNGAHVALRQIEDGKRELQIWREGPMKSNAGESLWAAEVTTFLRNFGCLGWEKEHGVSKGGGPAVKLTEVARTQDFFQGE